MRFRAAILTVPTVLVVLLACCGPAATGAIPVQAPGGTPGAPSAATEEQMTSGVASSDDVAPDLPAVAAARADFAASLGIAPDQVTVASVEEVTWSDGSLGCPQPGQAYVQVLTPGYRVVLEAEGQQAEYHTGQGPSPMVVRCDPALSRSMTLDLEKFGSTGLERSKGDLQTRVGVGTAITVLSTTFAPVTRLVCGESGPPGAGGPAQVILEYRLQAGDDVHLYRAWGDDILYCGLEAPADAPITE
jgi:hypothetical protein